MDWDWVQSQFGRDRMQRVLHHVPLGGRHLDAGTGKGDGTVLAARRTRCVGLEYGFTSLVAASSKGSDRLSMVQGDARTLPFAEASFDSVTCLDVLEHIPRPEEAVRELARVLRPGGLLILQTPSRELLKERLLRLARRLGYPQRQPYDRPLSLARLRSLLREVPLLLEHETPIPCWDPRPLVRLISRSRLFLCRKAD